MKQGQTMNTRIQTTNGCRELAVPDRFVDDIRDGVFKEEDGPAMGIMIAAFMMEKVEPEEGTPKRWSLEEMQGQFGDVKLVVVKKSVEWLVGRGYLVRLGSGGYGAANK